MGTFPRNNKYNLSRIAMIFKYRRFFVGGMLSVFTRDLVKNEVDWFDVKCVRLVDTVMLMLPFLQKQPLSLSDEILKYLFKHCKASSLPAPKDEWKNIDIDVLRLYYHIMTSLKQFPNEPTQYLLSHIKIDGKFVTITDFDGQGDNR